MRRLPKGYAIRPANSGDITYMIAADIAAGELFRPTGLIYNMPEVPDGVPTDLLRRAIAEDMVIAATYEDRAVGFALTSIRGFCFYLDQLSVDPKHGRKGLGRHLMQKVLEKAEENSLQEVYLSTFRDLVWNGPWYRKLGFKELPRKKMTPWMLQIEADQAEEMDVTLRCFMMRKVRRFRR